MADNHTPEQRSRTMSRIRSTGTAPERALRRALCDAGLRGYRLHRKDLPGNPDVVFGPARVAVFVDGAFWHGHPSAFRAGKSGSYWDIKIARNVERDRAATEALQLAGWTVLRFWDFEVLKEPTHCVEAVREALGARRST